MDWIASALTIIGMWLMARHRLTAMYVYLASSIAFIIWAALTRSWAILSLQIVLVGLNIRTIIIWRKHDKQLIK